MAVRLVGVVATPRRAGDDGKELAPAVVVQLVRLIHLATAAVG